MNGGVPARVFASHRRFRSPTATTGNPIRPNHSPTSGVSGQVRITPVAPAPDGTSTTLAPLAARRPQNTRPVEPAHLTPPTAEHSPRGNQPTSRPRPQNPRFRGNQPT